MLHIQGTYLINLCLHMVPGTDLSYLLCSETNKCIPVWPLHPFTTKYLLRLYSLYQDYTLALKTQWCAKQTSTRPYGANYLISLSLNFQIYKISYITHPSGTVWGFTENVIIITWKSQFKQMRMNTVILVCALPAPPFLTSSFQVLFIRRLEFGSTSFSSPFPLPP